MSQVKVQMEGSSETSPHRPAPLKTMQRNGGVTNTSYNTFAADPTLRPLSSSPMSSTSSKRQSFTEQLRQHPASPRQRHPSISQQAAQDLMNYPPVAHKVADEFENRDWKTIQVSEIIDPTQNHWSELDTTVEEATRILVTSGSPNVVLVRENKQSQRAVGTFGYSDLNAYLLLVVGLSHPDEAHVDFFMELARRGRAGKPVPLRDIEDVGGKEPLVTLPHTANLTSAMEIFGSGVHRIIVTRQGTEDVAGVLTQLRMTRFFWEHGRKFQAIEPLFSNTLKDLHIGSHSLKSINGDRPLAEALELMNNESITSLPVLDNMRNVVGNISHVDVRLLTKSTSLPLLQSSCIHFISVILTEQTANDEKDPFPVFYVNPMSTLAHTVAKLVATRSHRMWIVEQQSPVSSAPATPVAVCVPPPAFHHNSNITAHPNPKSQSPAVSASGLPGQKMSGRLNGVISLTDVLNLFARASGLKPGDPEEARRRRRRSSSSSQQPRVSIDSH